MTADWVAAQYKRIGLEQIESHEFTLPPQWFPTSWDVSVAGGGNTVAIKTAFPLYASVGTEATDLEPVWVGTGLPADFIGRDVRGKAAIVYGFPDPGGREDTAITFGAVPKRRTRPAPRRSSSSLAFRATSPTNRRAARRSLLRGFRSFVSATRMAPPSGR